jgi:hypothetical protein
MVDIKIDGGRIPLDKVNYDIHRLNREDMNGHGNYELTLPRNVFIELFKLEYSRALHDLRRVNNDHVWPETIDEVYLDPTLLKSYVKGWMGHRFMNKVLDPKKSEWVILSIDDVVSNTSSLTLTGTADFILKPKLLVVE